MEPTTKAKNLRRIVVTERVSTREVLMVGDGPDDLEGAAAVGTWFVAITAEQRIVEPCRFAIPNPTRLVPLIDNLGRRRQREASNTNLTKRFLSLSLPHTTKGVLELYRVSESVAVMTDCRPVFHFNRRPRPAEQVYTIIDSR